MKRPDDILLPCDYGSRTHEENVAPIIAAMIYPDDADIRARLVKQAEFVRKIDHRQIPLPTTHEELALIIREALQLRTPEDQNSKRLNYGLIASAVLVESVSAMERGNPVVLKAIKDRIAKISETSLKSIENRHWKDFKCVAHLFAAYIQCAVEAAPFNRQPEFPCAPGQLLRFVAYASHFRTLAISTIKPEHSAHGYLIDAADSVGITIAN